MLSNTAKKHLFYLVCLVCVIFYSYLLIFGEGGMLRLRQEEKNLLDASRIRNEELRKNQELQHKIDRIRNDQREIERIARARALGMVQRFGGGRYGRLVVRAGARGRAVSVALAFVGCVDPVLQRIEGVEAMAAADFTIARTKLRRMQPENRLAGGAAGEHHDAAL